MGADRYVRIVPDENSVLLVSNDGDCIETALETAKNLDEVTGTELDDEGMTDYIPPTDSPFEADKQPGHELYKYRVWLHQSVSPNQFVPILKSRMEAAMMGQACSVVLAEGN